MRHDFTIELLTHTLRIRRKCPKVDELNEWFKRPGGNVLDPRCTRANGQAKMLIGLKCKEIEQTFHELTISFSTLIRLWNFTLLSSLSSVGVTGLGAPLSSSCLEEALYNSPEWMNEWRFLLHSSTYGMWTPLSSWIALHISKLEPSCLN